MRIINLIAFLAMTIVNFIAVQTPIMGMSPGEVSDLFPAMFTPADFTFAIWSFIYLAVGTFVIKGLFIEEDNAKEIEIIGYLFMATCLYNIGWIIAWQHLHIGISFGLMFLLWATLAYIYYKLATNDARSLYTIPFSIYLGWIAVSILANFNVLLIDAGFAFMGMEQETWTTILILIGIVGGFIMLYLNKDVVFTTVLVWAFSGIVFKNGGGEMNMMVIVGIIGILLLIIATGIVSFRKLKSNGYVLVPAKN